MAENKNESTLRDAANASKNTVDAVKGVKSVGKMAGQIAAGDWLGAIKEFFKNPQGILTAILAPSLAIILLITYITSTLVGTVWGVITDDVAKSMVDDYQYMENAVGVKSFTPAYEYVSEQALAEVCEKVKALDLEEFDDVSEKVIFKDAETLQNWLGKGYQQMCKFSDNGNTYTGYMNVQNGMSGVFALMQDESNGYEVSYDNTNSDYTAWQKTVSIYDFGNTTVGITGAPKYASLEGDKIRNSQKALYNITYNNQKFKQDGISVAMFQTIYNLVYDYNKTAYVNSNECSQTVNLIANLEQAEEIRGSNTVNYESFGSYLYNMILYYDALKNDAYYLDPDVVARANAVLNFYKNQEAAKKSSYYNQIRNSVDGEYNEEENIDSPEVKMMAEISDDKIEKFIEFMGREEVYQKLLTYTVSEPKLRSLDTPIDNFIPSYNIGTIEKPNFDNLQISKVKTMIDVEISVDFCDYNTLGEIFGFFTINDNGERENENTGLINYVLNNMSKNETNTAEKDEEADTNPTEEVSKVVSGSVAGIDNNTFLWPLELVDAEGSGVAITSKYGVRKDPISGIATQHNGLDIGAPAGTPVVAAIPGKVIKSTYSSSLGNYVVIESEVLVGESKKTYRTVYAHLKQATVYAGNTVSRNNNIIGYVGSTGRSTGNHLHFEIQEFQVNGMFTPIDPETLLGGKDNFVMFGTGSIFGNTLESFFEESKDAGAATASVLTDAGYLKSSTFWQYKQNCFNVMFCANVSDDSKLPFFIDVDNIARNEDGTLKIVEFGSASFDSNGLFNENYLLAEQASQQYQKKYYAVYCQPSTIVTLPFAAYRTNFLGEQMTHSKWKDFWYGNHVSDSTGGLNVIVSRIPASHLQPYSKESNEDYQIRLQKWNKENENPLTTEYWNSTDYDEYKKFDYLSYSLCNNAYMFDVLNLQISMPDTNGNTHFLTGEDYKLNYGSNYLHYSGMMDTEYKTATEVLEENAEVSAFQLNSEGGSPVILGTSLMQDLYPKNLSYDVNDPDTYPYFVVSVSLAPAIQSENVKYKELSIYDVFDLDVVQDKSYIDKTTGYCWPVVQSYEHASVVTSTVDNGTIVAINKDAQYIIYKNSNGDYRKVSNIIPDDELYVGSKIFKGTTVLGRVPDGLMAQISRGGLTSEGKYKEANPLNAGSYLMTTTNISLRSDTALGEDSVGIFTKILSMMNGEVVDITRNTQGKNDGSIVIYSVENDLYYEYTNIGISPFIKVGDTISSNSRIGQAYVYVNDTTSKVGFRVYNVEQDNFGITTKIYLNPIQFFPDLSNVESSAKRIVIKNEDAEDGETLSGLILHKNKTDKLYSFIYPESAREEAVVWSSSDESIVRVDQDGNITATDKAGVAVISCNFATLDENEVTGIGAQCTVQVPEVLSNIYVNYKKNGETTSHILPGSDSIIDVVMVNGKATIDFDATNDQKNAFQGLKWSVTDHNGNPTNKATIDVSNGLLTATAPNTSSDYLIVKVESTSSANAANEEAVGFVTAKIRIVQPVKSIEIVKNTDSERIIHLFNNETFNSATVKEGVDYKIEPSNATYKNVLFELVGDDIASLSNQSGTETTIVPKQTLGVGYLNIKCYEYPGGQLVGGTSRISVKSVFTIDDTFELTDVNGNPCNEVVVMAPRKAMGDAAPSSTIDVNDYLWIKFKGKILSPTDFNIKVKPKESNKVNIASGDTPNTLKINNDRTLSSMSYKAEYTIINEDGTTATKDFYVTVLHPVYISVYKDNFVGQNNFLYCANGGSTTINRSSGNWDIAIGNTVASLLNNLPNYSDSNSSTTISIVDGTNLVKNTESGFRGIFYPKDEYVQSSHGTTYTIYTDGYKFKFKNTAKSVTVKFELKYNGKIYQTWTHTFNIIN